MAIKNGQRVYKLQYMQWKTNEVFYSHVNLFSFYATLLLYCFFSHCQQRSDNATMVPKYWQNAILFLHTWTINHNHPDADRHQVYTHLLIRLHFSIHHSRMIQGTSPDQTNNILMRNWNLYNLFKIISTFVNFSRIGPHNIYRRMWLQKRTCFSKRDG